MFWSFLEVLRDANHLEVADLFHLMFSYDQKIQQHIKTVSAE